MLNLQESSFYPIFTAIKKIVDVLKQKELENDVIHKWMIEMAELSYLWKLYKDISSIQREERWRKILSIDCAQFGLF